MKDIPKKIGRVCARRRRKRGTGAVCAGGWHETETDTIYSGRVGRLAVLATDARNRITADTSIFTKSTIALSEQGSRFLRPLLDIMVCSPLRHNDGFIRFQLDCERGLAGQLVRTPVD